MFALLYHRFLISGVRHSGFKKNASKALYGFILSRTSAILTGKQPSEYLLFKNYSNLLNLFSAVCFYNCF